MSFSKRPGRNTPQCYTKPLDSLKNWNNRFFWVDERVFPIVVDWRTNAPKDGMPDEGTYSIEAVRVLDTHRTPIQKQPEMLLCLVGISRRYYLGNELYPTFLHDDDRDMELFNLIRAPNPTKVKTGSRPRAPHEVPLLTLTAPRVIEMDEPAATDSSDVPSTIERSPLDFAHEAGASDQGSAAPKMLSSKDVPATAAPGAGQAEEAATTDLPAAPESRKRGRDRIDANAPPPKSLRRDQVDPRPSGSSHGEKSLAALQLGLASTVVLEDAVVGASDPDPLSFADAPSHHPADVAQSSPGIAVAGDPESKNASSPAEVGSPGSVYQPKWGVTNGSLLDTPEAFQDLVDHAALPGYFFELRHMPAPSVRARGQAAEEIRCPGGSPGQKNLSRGVENKKPRSTTGDRGRYEEGRKRQECWADQRTRRHACPVLGSPSEERAFVSAGCYPTAIAGRRWVIGHGLRLAVMKCGESLDMRQSFADVVSAGITKGMSEGLRHGVEHGHAQLNVDSIEAYDPEAEAKFSDTGEDAPQYICDLRPSSSQFAIPVYPEVRDPRNPWAYKEQMKLADAIAANISRTEKKKKCRIACRTHRVGSAHNARSDGVSVSVPTVVPQGLALLLSDAATQTQFDDT
uniref:Transposase (Putative), gypsy type n=1 Tax=Tanacetum cinerariifolium TaxID=118510 RepID=A0A6L2KTL4_TANCI|nr:transposase (putative), gypsy type [Tanacetum cinerariifolium]